MASPIAYEQPTINRCWQAFVAHIPTLALVFVVSIGLTIAGLIVYFLATGFVGALIVNSGAMGSLESGETITRGLARLSGEVVRLPLTLLANFFGVLGIAVPALYYQSGEVIGPAVAFGVLFKRPWRYLLAGLFFVLVGTIGFLLCIIPGIAVSLVAPVYVNRIFNTDETIFDAFSRSFEGVFRSEHGWTFVGIELLVGLVVIVLAICTCGLGALVAGPMGSFYVMNSAYRYGIISGSSSVVI